MRIPLLLIACAFSFSTLAQKINIIPKPASTVAGKGHFVLTPTTVLVVPNNADLPAAHFFNEYLKQHAGFAVPVVKNASGSSIRFVTRQNIKAPEKDGYTLKATPYSISIEGETGAGTFYGMQTLIQLFPVDTGNGLCIPSVAIQDAPRFRYRGMHLDVGRHLFPLSFIKKYIDYLALHKMNFFHWHLTEDQGWRIEIKRYPELTSIGGWRNGTIVGHFPGTANDNQRYGGFYTQDEVREVVQYAAARHITVVPEIEMPGHSSAAIAAYPWLSCFPIKETSIPHHPSQKSQAQKGKKVQETWGVFEDIFCAGNDSTFTFLQNVLDEVLALFPSQYIHVGGDEAPKDHWRQCPRCQERIRAEGLKDEHGLQSYFIRHMERYLNAKGRTIIGWDEILEGGLAPNAVVMSWRGEAGGIAAAKEKHEVIMTPGSHVYFDYSQSANEDSLTIGGYIPLEKVYSYEPVPKELPAHLALYVLGAQANLWTEYIQHPEKVEYMVFPRMSALSEVLWSPKALRNWPDFQNRLLVQLERYQKWKAHYSNAYFDIEWQVLPAPNAKGVRLKVASKAGSGKLLYGIQGSHFQKDYKGPVLVDSTTTLTAMYTRKGVVLDSTTIRIRFNKATGRKISISPMPAPNYPGSGAFTLADGIVNENGLARTSEFIGYNGKQTTINIDLGSLQLFESVKVHALAASASWIHPPQEVTVYVSTNGKKYTRMGTAREFVGSSLEKGALEVFREGTKARYLRLVVTPLARIPQNLPGEGKQAWMFLDEVEVL